MFPWCSEGKTIADRVSEIEAERNADRFLIRIDPTEGAIDGHVITTKIRLER
jgi:hypothetical protein